MKTLLVEEWLKNFGEEELIELAARPVASQLKFYDEVGSGIGFIMFLVPTIADTGADVDPADMKIELNVQSQPIIKMKNDWYTIDDDNMADVLSACFRMFKPEN